MSNTYKRYSSCRFCARQELVELLDFGYSAPANAFLKKDDKDNNQYPLVLSQCRSCGCTQLLDTIPGEVLFKNYSYSSSTIKSLVNHFESYSKTIPIKPNSRILEIGSNDGVLLQFLKQQGHFVLGVEPAENLAKLANDKGLETISVFFNESTAKDILNKYGKFDIITCNNCFAHIDDIHSVIKGIKILLKDDGYYVFENAYLLDTVNKLYFDQCLPPGQKILTERGILNIEEVSLKDKVLTHTGLFKHVTHLFNNKYNGEIIDIFTYGNSQPLSLTPEHPVYVLRNGKKEFIEAKNINNNDILIKACIKSNSEDITLEIDCKIGNSHNPTRYYFKLDEDLCKIFGYFIAEGHYYECKPGSAQVDFSFGISQSEKELAEDCSRCLKNHGAKGVIRWTKYGWHVTTYGAMARLLKREFNTGALNKNLPQWAFKLSNELSKTLLESYMKGDGYVYRNSKYLRGCSISEKLAQGMAFIANKIGYTCSINMGKIPAPKIIANNKKISILKNPAFEILVKRVQQKKCKVWRDSNYQYNLVKKIQKRIFNGNVFNLEVEDDNSYTMTQSTVHNCYFEHIFYHSVKPLNSLFERHNLEIFNIERNEIQGGTIRVFVSFPGVFINRNRNKFAIDSYIEQEEKAGLYSISTYNNFKYNLESLKAQLWDYIYSRGTSSKRVSCSAYGAAAKFTTFANFFGINSLLSYVVDDSPPKQNLYTPDSRIPIVNSEYFKANPTDICIITAWNFADSIIKNNEWYTKQGGKFIVCMPELRII